MSGVRVLDNWKAIERWRALVVATASTLFTAACAPTPPASLPTAAIPPTFPDFALAPETKPTISSGTAGWPIMSVDPDIYVDSEGFHLFYSTLFCREGNAYAYSWNPAAPAACDITNTITAIAYAFSGDSGLTWEFRRTPVVVPSESGFDGARIETASVFRLGDTLYLTYSADGYRDRLKFTSRYQIGVGSLALGEQPVRKVMMDESRQFERRATPLLPFNLTPGHFDNNVQEPSVLVGPEGIVLYYIGLGLRLPDQPIDAPGQGIMSVGLGRAVFDEHLNLVSRSANALLGGVNCTEVRYYNGAYHLFASTLGGGEAHQNEAISYATSSDGVLWTAPQIILSPGASPGFNDWGLSSPTAAVSANRVLLFFTAYGTASGACTLVGPDGRFGIALPDRSKCLFVTTGRALSALPPGGPQTTNLDR